MVYRTVGHEKGQWGGKREGAGRPIGSQDSKPRQRGKNRNIRKDKGGMHNSQLRPASNSQAMHLGITLTKDEWATLAALAPDGKPLKEAVRCIRAYLSTLTANSSATTTIPDTEAVAS